MRYKALDNYTLVIFTDGGLYVEVLHQERFNIRPESKRHRVAVAMYFQSNEHGKSGL